jgi:lysophospholipase L1-like esterase
MNRARHFTRAAVLILLAAACDGGGPTGPGPVPQPIRVVTFGDSNTDIGFSGTDPTPVVRSYVSSRSEGRLAASAPHSPLQLAGKIEAAWKASRAASITVVNHGVGGTTSGGGAGGGSDRHRSGAPNARTAVDGVTRFEAEVLGRGKPWSGGEPVSGEFPSGPIVRDNAFVPGETDFAYLSIGSNDQNSGLSDDRTIANLRWMVETWIAAGKPPHHLIMTTLAPRPGRDGVEFPKINQQIREFSSLYGIHVIDLAEYTSADDGLTWRSASLHLDNDTLHYSEAVRDWLAGQVVHYLRARVPG